MDYNDTCGHTSQSPVRTTTSDSLTSPDRNSATYFSLTDSLSTLQTSRLGNASDAALSRYAATNTVIAAISHAIVTTEANKDSDPQTTSSLSTITTVKSPQQLGQGSNCSASQIPAGYITISIGVMTAIMFAASIISIISTAYVAYMLHTIKRHG